MHEPRMNFPQYKECPHTAQCTPARWDLLARSSHEVAMVWKNAVHCRVELSFFLFFEEFMVTYVYFSNISPILFTVRRAGTPRTWNTRIKPAHSNRGFGETSRDPLWSVLVWGSRGTTSLWRYPNAWCLRLPTSGECLHDYSTNTIYFMAFDAEPSANVILFGSRLWKTSIVRSDRETQRLLKCYLIVQTRPHLKRKILIGNLCGGIRRTYKVSKRQAARTDTSSLDYL